MRESRMRFEESFAQRTRDPGAGRRWRRPNPLRKLAKKWTKGSSQAMLPPPCTYNALPSMFSQLAIWKKLLSFLIVITITGSFLSGIIRTLDDHLEEGTRGIHSESNRAKHNRMIPSVLNAVDNATRRPHPHRRLEIISEASPPDQDLMGVTAGSADESWLRITSTISLAWKLTTLLYPQSKGAMALCMLQNGGLMAGFNLSVPSVRPAMPGLIRYGIYKSQKIPTSGEVHDREHPGQHVLQQRSSKISLRGSGFHEQKAPQQKGLHDVYKDLLSTKVSALPSVSTRQAKFVGKPWPTPYVQASLLHTDAVKVVGNLDVITLPPNAAPPTQENDEVQTSNAQPQPLPSLPSFDVQNHLTPAQINPQLLNDAKRAHVFDGTIPDGIQMWDLGSGGFLCRIQNVARLSDGSLMLPKWMQSHSEFLQTRCGIKSALYAVENAMPQGFKVDTGLLARTKKSRFELDTSNSDRDLFGVVAPRNHMPHFVSDILFPLVASQALLQVEREPTKFATLHWSTGLQEEIRSSPILQLLKPSILVFDETINRPSSEWVPKLANFFKHPKLKFKVISAGPERPPQQKENDLVALVLKSVIVSNLAPHESSGLFGQDGNNIVLEANGITRNPPWTMKELREAPCRLRVTVLTRKGTRVLKVKDLEKRIKGHAAAKKLSIAFHIVDFGHMSFEEQVHTMQSTNILVATHGAGNSNFIFMRPGAAVIEVFPFSYKAGPFDRLAHVFGLVYDSVMSAPQTDVFKECMNRHEANETIKTIAFNRWDDAVKQEKIKPWVHRLEFEKEFGEPGKSQGITTRGCVRLQELAFNVEEVARMVVSSGEAQCLAARQGGLA